MAVCDQRPSHRNSTFLSDADGCGSDSPVVAGTDIPRVPGTGPSARRLPALRGPLAAIDLGTNKCRLLIARPGADGMVIVDAFSRIVRLGEGLRATGAISPAAMDRAVAALAVCADKLRRRHVTLSRAVATEACRQASNGQELIDRVYRETGIFLDIISAEQEAELAVLGCQALLEPGPGPALVFDIGGGSTELIALDPHADQSGSGAINDWISVPWGVVSLTEMVTAVGATEAHRRAAYAEMRAMLDDAFAPFARRMAEKDPVGPLRLLGTSGTVTTLASLHLGLTRYDRRAVDGVIVPADALRAISQHLAGLSYDDRVALPCLGPERADLVVAGCAILEAIIDLWPATRVGVADRGLREGILRRLAGSGVAVSGTASPRGGLA